jgi:hypothetical protein
VAARKTRSGRWRVDFRDRRGRRQRVTFDTKAEANDFASDTRRAIRRRLYVDPKRSPTVKRGRDRMASKPSDRAPGTYELYKSHLDNHVTTQMPRSTSLRRGTALPCLVRGRANLPPEAAVAQGQEPE